jgi:hypothetical protein
MTEDNKKMKLVFTPGCLDSFEGTQEELDELVAEIKRMFESGEFIEKAVPVTDESIDDLPDEVLEKISRALDEFDTEGQDITAGRKLH